jgi:hypothetical protein
MYKCHRLGTVLGAVDTIVKKRDKTMWHLSKNSKDEKERRMFQIKRKSRKG